MEAVVTVGQDRSELVTLVRRPRGGSWRDLSMERQQQGRPGSDDGVERDSGFENRNRSSVHQAVPATNKAIFTLEPDGDTTKVTWAMEGHKNFMAKALHAFVNMDKLIGKDFESGLASMGWSAARRRGPSQPGND
jgi:hypothetical protein